MFVGTNLTNIRILHGYTRKELAEILNITEQSIWQYENGYTSPKMETLNKLKRLFNVKSQYFYKEDFLNNKSADTNQNHIAYRATIINSAQKTQFEAKHIEYIDAFLNIIGQKIRYPKNEIVLLREKTIEIMNDDNYDRKTNIERAANYARKFLELDTKGNGNLLFMLEKKGAFIIEKAVGEKVDAYSIWVDENKPFIVLGNLKKSAVRRNFDLAHELGHLLMHYKVEFSLLDKSSYREHEQEAHLFAGAFLLPKEEFIKDFEALPKPSNPDCYLDLKRKWLVSIQALAYRAYSLKMLDYQKYRYFNALINKRDYKINEPLDDEIKINRPGKIRSVLQLLFEKGKLTVDDLLNSLEVDIEFLIKLLGLDRSFFEMYQGKESRQFTVHDLNFKAE